MTGLTSRPAAPLKGTRGQPVETATDDVIRLQDGVRRVGQKAWAITPAGDVAEVTIDQIITDYEIEFSPEYSARCGHAEYPDTSLFCDEFAALAANSRRLKNRLVSLIAAEGQTSSALIASIDRMVALTWGPK